MDEQSPTEASQYSERPRALHGFDLGVLASLAVAMVYGVLADPIGLTWGLIAVGFIGGMLIGTATRRSASGRRAHPASRRIQLLAAVLAAGSWFVAIVVAYVMGQLFYQEAGTSFLARISIDGWAMYFGGLYEAAGISHAAAVAAMVFMSWRGAR